MALTLNGGRVNTAESRDARVKRILDKLMESPELAVMFNGGEALNDNNVNEFASEVGALDDVDLSQLEANIMLAASDLDLKKSLANDVAVPMTSGEQAFHDKNADALVNEVARMIAMQDSNLDIESGVNMIKNAFPDNADALYKKLIEKLADTESSDVLNVNGGRRTLRRDDSGDIVLENNRRITEDDVAKAYNDLVTHLTGGNTYDSFFDDKPAYMRGLIDAEKLRNEIKGMSGDDKEAIKKMQALYDSMPYRIGAYRNWEPGEKEEFLNQRALDFATKAADRKFGDEISDDYTLKNAPEDFDWGDLSSQLWNLNEDTLRRGIFPITFTSNSMYKDDDGNEYPQQYTVRVPFGSKLREFRQALNEKTGGKVPPFLLPFDEERGEKTSEALINAIKTGDWSETPLARYSGYKDPKEAALNPMFNEKSLFYTNPGQYMKEHAQDVDDYNKYLQEQEKTNGGNKDISFQDYMLNRLKEAMHSSILGEVDAAVKKYPYLNQLPGFMTLLADDSIKERLGKRLLREPPHGKEPYLDRLADRKEAQKLMQQWTHDIINEDYNGKWSDARSVIDKLRGRRSELDSAKLRGDLFKNAQDTLKSKGGKYGPAEPQIKLRGLTLDADKGWLDNMGNVVDPVATYSKKFADLGGDVEMSRIKKILDNWDKNSSDFEKKGALPIFGYLDGNETPENITWRLDDKKNATDKLRTSLGMFKQKGKGPASSYSNMLRISQGRKGMNDAISKFAQLQSYTNGGNKSSQTEEERNAIIAKNDAEIAKQEEEAKRNAEVEKNKATEWYKRHGQQSPNYKGGEKSESDNSGADDAASKQQANSDISTAYHHFVASNKDAKNLLTRDKYKDFYRKAGNASEANKLASDWVRDQKELDDKAKQGNITAAVTEFGVEYPDTEKEDEEK